jgi:hypothetical protein
MKIFLGLIFATTLFGVGSYKHHMDPFFTFALCGYMMDKESFFREGSPDRKIEDSIYTYSKFLKNEKDLKLRMHGMNCRKIHELNDNAIDTISLTYSLDRHMEYREARALLYEIADGFIAHMNEQKDLLQYFYKPPIGYEHLDLCIAFDYELKGNLKVGEMDDVRISENTAIYFIVNKELPPKMELTSTADAEVFTLGNFCSNTRRVIRALPETEQDIATEP